MNSIQLLIQNKTLLFPFTVGALLYTPALHTGIVSAILDGKIPTPFSLALCLEDSINDCYVDQAKENIITIFSQLKKGAQKKHVFLPKLFIRVRSPLQIPELYERLQTTRELLTGFIIPKYSPSCSLEYNKQIQHINEFANTPVYMMPILESPDLINLSTRVGHLTALKTQLDSISDYVLNVRVGGNDFCKEFGIRRHYNETIYETLAIGRLLSDIIAVFSRDYVVSGPVWEYFSSEKTEWSDGLKRELTQDRQNGFIGKTVIHPKQIPFINESLMVEQKDYEDAVSILSWSKENPLFVSKTGSGERMNEIKTHEKWAKKIISLAHVYGIKEKGYEKNGQLSKKCSFKTGYC